ncbi:MAG TPA: dTDP-4-dehydrorhamnose 3,5-epimerase [Bacteroidales bacterium]|nr:dTDP-4-dehydrorhamnose 3,5-epimerase [Bacteroidales bacterium]
MKVIETGFSGLYIIEPVVFKDKRGYFFESYNMGQLKENKLNFTSLQDNESYSSGNVIRGLHYQLNPMAQAKLIRVVKGHIRDVVLDMRKGSPTYGKWKAVDLDSESKYQLFIPGGFAHGFSVLSKEAIILYKCDNYYSPDHERGVAFDDPALDIDWGIDPESTVVSEKDRNNPPLSEADNNFEYIP